MFGGDGAGLMVATTALAAWCWLRKREPKPATPYLRAQSLRWQLPRRNCTRQDVEKYTASNVTDAPVGGIDSREGAYWQRIPDPPVATALSYMPAHQW